MRDWGAGIGRKKKGNSEQIRHVKMKEGRQATPGGIMTTTSKKVIRR